MPHFVSLPVLVPMLAGILLLLPPSGKNLQARRIVSSIMALLTLVVSGYMLNNALSGEIFVYAIGNWQAPFGIVLVADVMSSLLVTLTSFLALICVLYSLCGDDEAGSFFHPLLHFLLLGVNGAFLTGDLFNLFVFFEVLLISSYALLMHSSDKHKTQSALHYVVLNLVGSSVFLVALGILYGVLGTLNIADMAAKAAQLSGDDRALLNIGGMLLLIVFALKAAVIPLQFWLPATYASALPVVAALFAIMTKVGIYAIIRVYPTIFVDPNDTSTHIAQVWLWPAAIITLVIGMLGVLASKDLRMIVANLVIVSIGTLIAAVAFNTPGAIAAALYYLVHSTLVTAGLFLLADVIGKQRGKVGVRLVPAKPIGQPILLGTSFIVFVLAVVGMPPFSGFIGKVWLLQEALNVDKAAWFWAVYLVVSLLVLVTLTRAGSQLFWRHNGQEPSETKATSCQLVGVISLLLCSPLLSIFAGPISEITTLAATQVFDTLGLQQAVLGGK
ncbi:MULTISPECIES: monovalent cation/H+ antiporter subunit D [Pseudoalteromonas]|uniref:monovalent cation/H+ antiporter subunit D n=1 Tax=Pseudoalteromonas TaxID=53246 RepID=UPI00026CB39D|nr:monovalent cation/H+ antiporter subunit D [Pseudoalteromonas spongiae]ATC99008.1 multicomponent K+:H+ antiporter subunit D [Pseudoalteromonas spongiae UST010723-006]